MLKKILIILIIVTSIFFSMTTIKIDKKDLPKNDLKNEPELLNKVNFQTNQIGNLIIEKINLNEPLFKIDSEENTVDKHLEILKESIYPNKEKSIIFIAAHSGIGKIAYFNRLDELTENDKIKLIINNETFVYEVKNVWEEKKNGYINVNKEKEDQLVLTTCSPSKEKYQLIVNCIRKES